MVQNTKISKNNTKVFVEDNVTKVVLYNTPVVTIDYLRRCVTLNTGGWLTSTTINRMSQAIEELVRPFTLISISNPSRAKDIFSINIAGHDVVSDDNRTIEFSF